MGVIIVGTGVSVGVTASVGVGVGFCVGVAVGPCVGVAVGISVGVDVGVSVGISVGVGVVVTVLQSTALHASSLPYFQYVPVPLILSALFSSLLTTCVSLQAGF